MTEERFEQIAAEEVDALPAWILERLAEVSIEIDDRPPPQYIGVQGLYIGCPPTERAESFWTGREPARIILYRRPLWCEDDDQQRELVRRTLRHEVAHAFGLSDAELLAMDRY